MAAGDFTYDGIKAERLRRREAIAAAQQNGVLGDVAVEQWVSGGRPWGDPEPAGEWDRKFAAAVAGAQDRGPSARREEAAMSRQQKGMTAVAAAAERVRAAAVRSDAEIAALNGVSAGGVRRSKEYFGLPADASAAELSAAAEAYVEHGPEDPAKRPVWEEMVARTRRARDTAASASTAPAPGAPAPVSGLVKRDPDTGAMTYLDVPVQMTSSGEPAVATQNGWMSVSAAAAAGLTADDLRLPYDLAQLAANGPSARMLKDGPR